MKMIVKAALAVAAIGSLPILVSAPASAYTDVTVSTGNVAFGYRDGYYDRDYRWHRWDNDDDSYYYRRHYSRYYRDYDHDRDDDYWRSRYHHDRGWHRGWYHHDDYDRDRNYGHDYNSDDYRRY